MKKLVTTLFLIMGICFLASNCINDDDFRGSGSSTETYAMVVDSFSVWLSAINQKDTIAFDSVLMGDTVSMQQIYFHINVLQELEKYAEVHKMRQNFGFAEVYAEAPPQVIRLDGVTDILISSNKEIHTEFVSFEAGADLKSLFRCKLPTGDPTWQSVEEYVKYGLEIEGIQDLSMQLSTPLRKGIYQDFTFTLVNPFGDSLSALSTRVVAR